MVCSRPNLFYGIGRPLFLPLCLPQRLWRLGVTTRVSRAKKGVLDLEMPFVTFLCYMPNGTGGEAAGSRDWRT